MSRTWHARKGFHDDVARKRKDRDPRPPERRTRRGKLARPADMEVAFTDPPGFTVEALTQESRYG